MSPKRFLSASALALALTAAAGAALPTVAAAGNGYRRNHVLVPPPRHQWQHQRRHRHGNDVARGVAIGVGALIVGSMIVAGSRQARADSAEQRCADAFPSFNWNTGTIVNRYGERVTCPYLD